MFDPSPIAAAVMLDIAGKTWLYPGVREHVVRECLDLSPTQFWQAVNVLIDTELALQLDPVTTKRLRSVRDRRSVRSA